ncbi:hypothetical protein PSE_4915 [Pseudovibrio sp. FO-BEG1]|uniref:hypothetical protein n=1 Tax=Pseudovibrio sp. (strain FO-BEG1) TaxID=911045 RepID=UPI000238BE36|nr:hypothetical protein [Pseudovibrio sp. FO-BEG1]AEV39417.1 hypothetical protein PSE_4915 [Pseudovibrio sp. FO-BEG1]
MSAIQLSSFVEAAQFDNGLDKLHTTNEEVTQRTSHTSVGGKLLSWALNGGQKSADQSRFQEALKAEFGDDTAQAAYDAFAPKGSKSHSLTKAQVLDTVEFALRTQEDKAEERNTSAQTDILASVRKTYGDAVASETSTLLEGSSEFAKAAENPEQIKATVREIAEGIYQGRLAEVSQDISSRLGKLNEPGALEAYAEKASINIDWPSVSEDDRNQLLSSLKVKLIKQSHASAQEPKQRQFLTDEKVDQAITNQLLILTEIKMALPGGEVFDQTLEELGLQSSELSPEFQTKISEDLSHELQILLGEDGTKTITGDLRTTEKKIIQQAVSMVLLKDVARAETKTQAFKEAIARFNPEETPEISAYMEKLFSHLGRSQVEADMLAGKSFEESGGVVEATKAEVWKQLSHFETAGTALVGFIDQLNSKDLNAGKFSEIAKTFAANAKSSGADDIGKILDIQLANIFRSNPDLKQSLLQNVESGQLTAHANALGAGMNLLRNAVENQLILKANRDGIDPDSAVLEVNTITATATRPIDYLLSNFVEAISNLEKQTVVSDATELKALSEEGRSQNDAAVKHNEEVKQKYHGIMQAFAAPEKDKVNAPKVAAGLANNLSEQLKAHDITVSF